MVNKTLGNHFEGELCELLAENGFWAHNLAQNQTGQPADVIAVKNNIAMLIDCKVCSNDRFVLSRSDENQEMAMTLWEQRGNAECYFAIKVSSGEIYMAHFDDLYTLRFHGAKSISEKDMGQFPTFQEWVEVSGW